MSDLLNSASLVMIPSGYKEDIVYSQIPTNGNGDLSFTRASNGTRINSAGLVEVCPWNLLQYSEEFSNATWTKSATTLSANTTVAPNGTTTADTLIENTANSTHQIFQSITNVNGATPYTAMIYVKENASRNVAIRIQDGAFTHGQVIVTYNLNTGALISQSATGNGVIVSTSATLTNGYYLIAVSFSINLSTSFRYDVLIVNGTSNSYTGDGTSSIVIWGAQLNIGSTAKPYFPTTDRLNVPRLTYQNGGGGCPSLLLEKQSTNLVIYSEQFDQWNTQDASVTANQIISPDGTQNADKIVENNQNQPHYIYSNTGTYASADYTVSVYAKAGERSILQIFFNGSTNIDAFANFDLTNGMAYATSSTATITSVGNGWYRCTITATLTAATLPLVFYCIQTSTSATRVQAYSGNGTNGLYLWGAQVEASSYPTSYIPTTSSSATRVADLSTSDTIQTAQTFAGDFTFFVDFVSFTTTDALGPTNQMLIGGGNQALGATYKSYFWITQQSVQLTGDSETTIIASTKTFNANQRYKLLVKRNGTTVKIFCDGVQVGASATSSLSITIRSIGWSYSNNYRFNGLINQVVLSATGFSDADCQALTTL